MGSTSCPHKRACPREPRVHLPKIVPPKMSPALGLILAFAFCDFVTAYNYPEECPRISPIEIDPVKYRGGWYSFTHNEGSEFACSLFLSDFMTIPGENYPIEKIVSQTRYTNGSVIDDSVLLRVLPTLEGAYNDQTPDKENIYSYFILDTDYISYSVGFFCYLNDEKKVEKEAFYLSRSRRFPEGLEEKMDEVLKRNGLEKKMKSTPESCEGLVFPTHTL